MKNNYFISLFILFITISINAQDSTESKFMIQPFIGYSGLNNNVNLELLPNGRVDEYSEQPTYPYKNSINYGLKGEYKISNKIGVGFEFNYSQFKGEAYKIGGYSIFGDSSTIEDYYTRKANNYSLFLRFNYHFYQKNNIDIYSAIGLGVADLRLTGLQTSVYTSVIDNGGSSIILDVEPNDGQTIHTQDLRHSSYNPIYKVAFGVNYSPFKNFGVNFETGYRGSFFAQTGISYKFNCKSN